MPSAFQDFLRNRAPQIVATLWLVGGLPGAVARADERLTSIATMSCDRSDAPGRVRCQVQARVNPEAVIAWADVVFVTIPPSVGALRGRFGPHDTALKEPSNWRWEIALIARSSVSGVVTGRVRLVACKARVCVPQELPFQGSIVVGAASVR